ncbi:MAG TPA: Ig-like domain-containing protein [Gemmatimonadales bacterium]|nr:Ig-like domain-containing protein [Gemmatimonadales bacterium]
MAPSTEFCSGCGTPLSGEARFCMHCGRPAQGGAGRVSSVDLLRDQLIQATQGEYEILEELGRGGMAAVFLGRDLSLGRQVALKVMIPGLDAAAGMADRFLLEARTAAQLSHTNIIPIYAVRTTGELRFFVMKFIPGRSLDQVLAAEGPLPPDLVRAVLAQVGSALEHAHARGVVHRDIKPANIMIDDDGSAIVADFGIAKVSQSGNMTRTGVTIGTPAYMSPEQCTGQPVGGASDQYALGCVAFELLTGRPPFVHEEAVPVLLAHVSDPPPPLLPLCHACPLPLAAAIERMLAKSPADRWPTLADALEAAEAAAAAADPEVRRRLRQLADVREPAAPLPPPPPSVPPPSAARTVISGPHPVRLSLPTRSARLVTGESLRLDAAVLDAAGAAVSGAPLRWRSTVPEIASVSDGGVVTGLAEGQSVVTALCGNISAEVEIVVERIPVGRLALTPAPSAWAPGERRVLQAVALDRAGAVLPGRSIRWTSLDPAVAVVDQLGVVLGVGEGQARIVADCEGERAEVVVDIRPASGTLTVLPGAGALAAGQVVGLEAVWRVPSGSPRPARGVVWSSSDPGTLRVSETGELTALRPGNARIRATLGEYVAEVPYQVTRVDVVTVRIVPNIPAFSVGEEARLQAQGYDRLGSPLGGRVVSWRSSDPKVVIVSPDGVIRGVGPGQARISAGIGAGLASVDLRVSPATVAAIRIEPQSASVRVGEALLLRASVQGSRGTTLPGVGVEWLSSDPQVASVSPEGVVQGLRFGTVRIAASAGGRRATVAVEVRAASVTTISAPRIRVSGEKA